MCGIVGGNIAPSRVEAGVTALRHRGPDAEGLTVVGEWALGHTRLAVRDLDPRSDQPYARGKVTLAYNGELWNAEDVRADLEALGERFTTTGDTEVVAAALDQWGTDALGRMEGMWALAWTDGEALWLSRDRFGEIPLHVNVQGSQVCWASEIRGLAAMGVPASEQLEPGAWLRADGQGVTLGRWYVAPLDPTDVTRAEAEVTLRGLMEAAVYERAVSDVPVAALVSGGLDSSAVALQLTRWVPGLRVYTAVLNERSSDLKFARRLAEARGLDLTEVRVEPPTADDLSSVVRQIEMPFKAQVEIAWACLALAQKMAEDGIKVVLSGEGSDELWASYGFAYHQVAAGADWHEYRRKLFVDQHRKNFARTNKVFMAHGIEARLPFLHRPVVEYVLSLRREVCEERKRFKVVLEGAMRGDGDHDVPEFITRRGKLAFQEGTGMREAAAEAVGKASTGDARGFYLREFKRYTAGQTSLFPS